MCNVLPCHIVLSRKCHRLVIGHGEVKLGCWRIEWKFSKFDRWILINFFSETGWFLISMVHNWGKYITKTIKSTIRRYVTRWIGPTCQNGQKSKIPNFSNKCPIFFLLSFGTTIVVILWKYEKNRPPKTSIFLQISFRQFSLYFGGCMILPALDRVKRVQNLAGWVRWLVLLHKFME